MTSNEWAATPPSLSYELYPPATPKAAEAVLRTIDELSATNPDYVSVTFSGTPERRRASIDLIEHLVRNTRLRPLAHLTCVGETRESLELLVRQFLGLGVRGLLALRGDLPQDADVARGDLPFARFLVELIRDIEGRHTATLAGGRLAVGVAAYPNRHPESPSFLHDIEVLVSKQRAGADFAITQVYFDPTHYARLVTAASAAGVTMPIIPGVMPMANVGRLERLAVMTGVRPDKALLHRLETASDGVERRRIGVQAAAVLAQAAFDGGAPGLHLYTFNDHRASVEVIEQLDLPAIRTLADVVPA
ncbi:methylenetetrahydrofolate reductase (NADPH) [Arthrobacter sp. PL16]|uniref:methylenetetrahydrofolate reductase n=1 Tax=Arthrobacter sp. PL16 TaxID=3071720 RepID=UPI002E080643|nr:methylenetetrahydrofolate reductase (NADPH) [Arthrobacter sp. PL16]